MDTNSWINALIAIVSIGGSALITQIVNWLKSKQKATTDNKTIEYSLNGKVLDFINEQEEGIYTGDTKKVNVLRKINQLCSQEGKKFDYSYWDDRIDYLVAKCNKFKESVK